MKVNYDFYSGKDEYSDGEVEESIIKYLKEYGEDNYQTIFRKDIRWPVFYHISPIRKNIINWYPFKQDSEVLEIGAGMGAITGALCDKAKHVTAVELSKQRAEAIQARCYNRENLEIIVGNFNDIKFEKKFDYITLIGVLEYASLYTGTKNSYHDFLNKIKKLLKDDGKLLIAIENQFGLKYFSGAPEDHTAKVYDGILGYEKKEGIRTFGKEVIKEILNETGYINTKFYYPMPDYKLPNIIFSDEYLPDDTNISNYEPYVSNEKSKVKFDEKIAFKDIIKNKKFDFFANSFFIEASNQKIETKVNLQEQKLNKIDEVSQQFYDLYGINNTKIDNINYIIDDKVILDNKKIIDNDKKIIEENRKLIEENKILSNEINKMVNSKSWKITKPIRDFKLKFKGKE